MAYCSGCDKRHDARDCPHRGVTYRQSEWVRQALAEQENDDE